MKFEIDFNRKTNDKILKEIGATLDHYNLDYSYYWVELNSFEELEELLEKVNKLLKPSTLLPEYLAVIGFNPPTIYLDDEV